MDIENLEKPEPLRMMGIRNTYQTTCLTIISSLKQ
jgi:hypothetical protein